MAVTSRAEDQHGDRYHARSACWSRLVPISLAAHDQVAEQPLNGVSFWIEAMSRADARFDGEGIAALQTVVGRL